MIINQKEDGSGEIIFSEEEKKIIIDKGKLIMTEEFLKHFANHLMRVFVEWDLKFKEKTKTLNTFLDTEIKTK
jgi:hypothetical protein